MPLFTHNGKLIFFAHVPKCGGTSVEDYLIRRFGALTIHGRSKLAGTPRSSFMVSPTHLSAADLKDLLPGNIDYTFTVVRDPMSRILSEFRFQSGHSKLATSGFSNWLKVILKAAEHDPRIYHNHIRPQSDLVPEGAEIFKLEDGLEPLAKRLDEVTGTTAPDVEPQHLLKKERREVDIARDAVARLIEFYREDYERFGYEVPSLSDYEAKSPNPVIGLAAGPISRMVVARQRRRWMEG